MSVSLYKQKKRGWWAVSNLSIFSVACAFLWEARDSTHTGTSTCMHGITIAGQFLSSGEKEVVLLNLLLPSHKPLRCFRVCSNPHRHFGLQKVLIL